MSEIDTRSESFLRTRMAGRSIVVELRGEIDIVTVPLLSVRLESLISGRPCPELVVDLRSVTFIDCSGLGALCRARNLVLKRGGRLRLVVDCPRILRTLRLAGLAGTFEVSSGLADLPYPRRTAAAR